ncbi:WG repeat-containing protein [Cetobacterium sp.]|uniref:WG repeat-containing protein n=1 Tax=Cetobacterium sp. TaxID=2071632 RepID=UPI003F2B9C6A
MRVKQKIILLLTIVGVIYFSDKIKQDEELEVNSYKGIFKEYTIEMDKNNLNLKNKYKTKNYKLQNFEYDQVISIADNGVVFNKDEKLNFKKNDLLKKTNFKFIQSLEEGLIVSENNKFGFLNKNLSSIIIPKYDELSGNDESFLLRAKLNGKIGYITKKGEEVVPFIYENGSIEKDGVILLKKDNKIGALSEKGKLILDFMYDAIFFDDNQYFILKVGDSYYSLDIKKWRKKKLDLTWIGVSKEGKAFYEKDGKFGLIKLNGEKITENIYSEFSMNYNNLIISKLDDKYGLISDKGNIIVPITYDYIIPLGNYIFEAGIDSKDRIDILDYNGKFLLSGHYDNIIELNKDFIIFEQNKIKNIFNKRTKSFEIIDEIIDYNKDLLVYKKKERFFVKKIKLGD